MTNYVTEYKVTKIKPYNKIKNDEKLIGRIGQNYSVFGFSVEFERHTKLYLWIYYLPSMSVVIIAGKNHF